MGLFRQPQRYQTLWYAERALSPLPQHAPGATGKISHKQANGK